MKLPLRVDIQMKLSDVATAVGGKLQGEDSAKMSGVCLDTRALKKGDLFFALRDQRDGHEFVEEAIRKGAAGVVVSEEGKAVGPRIVVTDTTRALGALARSVRRSWGKKVVAISGSNGKTTTKEMTAALLGESRSVLKAPGTWNNALGVPLSLLMLKENHEVVVLELGINHFGEMKILGEIAEPDVAVLTNIGPSHLEMLGSPDGVAKAKAELFDTLRPEGIAVINRDDHHIARIGAGLSVEKVTVSLEEKADVFADVSRDLGLEGLVLNLRYGSDQMELRTPFVGMHNVSNLLCACGAAKAIGISVEHLQNGLNRALKPEMRMEVISCKGDIRIVNDCYNSNPASMLAALTVCKDLSAGRRIAVVGDMMELGTFAPRAHRDVGIRVAQLRYDHLFVIGQYAGDITQGAIQGGMSESNITVGTSRIELAKEIEPYIQSGDVVLVKGSRGMKMEEITSYLLKASEGGHS